MRFSNIKKTLKTQDLKKVQKIAHFCLKICKNRSKRQKTFRPTHLVAGRGFFIALLRCPTKSSRYRSIFSTAATSSPRFSVHRTRVGSSPPDLWSVGSVLNAQKGKDRFYACLFLFVVENIICNKNQTNITCISKLFVIYIKFYHYSSNKLK